MGVLIEADVVEDEELRLRTEVGRVGDLRVLQIALGALGDAARVAAVALLGHRIDDVADQVQGGDLGERVHEGGVRIGHDEHVALVDRLEAADGRTVEAEPFLEAALGQLVCGHREVLPQTGHIHEAQINDLDVVVFDQFQHVRRLSHFVWRLLRERGPGQEEVVDYSTAPRAVNALPPVRHPSCPAIGPMLE